MKITMDIKEIITKFAGVIRGQAEIDYVARTAIANQIEKTLIPIVLEAKEKEVNKLLQSHSEWMTLAIDRKKENQKLKERVKELEKELKSWESMNGNDFADQINGM